MNDSQFGRPSPRMKKFLRQARTSYRGNCGPYDGGGACVGTSEEAEQAFGYKFQTGGHSDVGPHAWNKLPDGRILDATADQFSVAQAKIKGHRGVKIIRPTDDEYLDYGS